MSVQTLIWTLIAVTGALDIALFWAEKMTIVMNWRVAVFLVTVYGLSRVMRQRYAATARLFGVFVQILMFCQLAAYLTYAAMAASPFPMADNLLSHADAAIGFDWLAWFIWVRAHPAVHIVLAIAYASIPLQTVVLLTYFTMKDGRRIDEMIIATILTVAMVIPGMVLLPAVGAWTQHGVGLVEPWRSEILALRTHNLVAVGVTQGIVSFPSFHTACAVLLVNMARGHKWFSLVLGINAILIVSVMSEGAHYGVDVIGGLAVSLLAIAAARWLIAQCSQADRVFPVSQAVRTRPSWPLMLQPHSHNS